MFPQKQKSRFGCWRWLIIVIGVLVLFGVLVYRMIHVLDLGKILSQGIIKEKIVQQLGEENADVLVTLLPDALGFSEPRTYLLLFLNNTELRPGGGFIGSYATVRMDKGKMTILALEGTEGIDGRAPETFKPTPPKVYTEHLGVERWYFRDANWSPDFAVSSEKALELYRGEGGVDARDIDAVVGITTDVLEDLLAITGPITVDGITFTSDNVIETLEYEVEYGYGDKGIHFTERKDILRPFMLALMNKVQENLFGRLDEFKPLFQKLIHEKHVMMYSPEIDFQEKFLTLGLDGTMKKNTGDYLMWVDANLAALKTDHAIERNLSYTIAPSPYQDAQGHAYYIAGASMEYVHTGTFDWRTTRYRTYARIFVPTGAELIDTIGAMKSDRSAGKGTTDTGVEDGKQWFGAFISIEPGDTKELTFIYRLPDVVFDSIRAQTYHLDVQKQAGTDAIPLTLQLNFDTTITSAKPGEVPEEWGDSVYRLATDLAEDRVFEINLRSN